MNKSKLISVALICALGLGVGACVDNEESASVTNIRDQKAGLYSAQADLAKAQAEATRIKAEADKAYREAETAYQKALAEQKQTEADIAKAKMETEIANALIELETAKLNLEKARIEAEYALKQIQNDAQVEYIGGLLNNYNFYSDQVNLFTGDWLQAKHDLISLQYDSDSFEAKQANLISEQNVKIATSKALITEYEKVATNGVQELRAAIDAAKAQQSALQESVSKLSKDAAAAKATVDGQDNAFNNSAYAAAAYKIETAYNDLVPAAASFMRTENVSAKKEYLNNGVMAYMSGISFTRIVSVNMEAVAAVVRHAKVEKDTADAQLARSNTKLAKLNSDATIAWNKYTASTEAEGGVLYTAWQTAKALADAEQAINNGMVQNAKEAAVTYSDFVANQAALADRASYETLTSALVADNTVWIDTKISVAVKTAEKSVVDSKVSGLGTVATSAKTIAQLIADENVKIADAENEIKLLKDRTSVDQLVAAQKDAIARLEGQIAQAQANVDKYKALLNTALAE